MACARSPRMSASLSCRAWAAGEDRQGGAEIQLLVRYLCEAPDCRRFAFRAGTYRTRWLNWTVPESAILPVLRAGRHRSPRPRLAVRNDRRLHTLARAQRAVRPKTNFVPKSTIRTCTGYQTKMYD